MSSSAAMRMSSAMRVQNVAHIIVVVTGGDSMSAFTHFL
eukprot:CAMPEP_0185198336 /NCGR_PEP_ID=MMETSP1140-20130426/42637_1 /TAXON_ID=298111 /ORGANISM="Pavlova sp., Strain CCMP459" /LENGTH=38 /DNA_ID= /DNA_START= /DNA_END= /DNA_ORIENTATION=